MGQVRNTYSLPGRMPRSRYTPTLSDHCRLRNRDERLSPRVTCRAWTSFYPRLLAQRLMLGRGRAGHRTGHRAHAMTLPGLDSEHADPRQSGCAIADVDARPERVARVRSGGGCEVGEPTMTPVPPEVVAHSLADASPCVVTVNAHLLRLKPAAPPV